LFLTISLGIRNIDFIRAYWWALLILAGLVGWLVFIYVRKAERSNEQGDKKGADIGWEPLKSNLSWDGSDDAARAASLEAVYDYVLRYCRSAIIWYQGRRRPKRGWGLFLRTSALVLTALAGGVPLLADFGIEGVPAAVSTILIAMAGVFVSIDGLQGHTSGWVRYMLAQQRSSACGTPSKSIGTVSRPRTPMPKQCLIERGPCCWPSAR